MSRYSERSTHRDTVSNTDMISSRTSNRRAVERMDRETYGGDHLFARCASELASAAK